MRFTFILVVGLLLLATRLPADDPSAPFVHPGLLHSAADLARMKKMVAQSAEPWRSGFEQLRRHPQSQSDWHMAGPVAEVDRFKPSCHQFDLDGNAAYQNALLWCLTGDEAHAKKAVQILNAWSGTLLRFSGRDKILGASLGSFKYVNAAELIRYTYPGWSPAEVRQFEQMLRNAVYPAIQDFATFANGNWDTGCIKTMLAIGVFCDDRAIYNRALDYYRNGSGNGRLTHYVLNEAGQCQESGRDQQHAQLGLAHLAEACEIAWNQGVDLYSFADNRLLRGFEYTAQYNLGHTVPFTSYTDTTGKYKTKVISAERRGELRPIYEMVWNHYENRRGIPAPFTKQAAEKIRPEGAAQGAAQGADHPGFGTLLFSRRP